MSTPGYEPLQTLWHLFQADDAITAKMALTKPQLEQIRKIVSDVIEKPEGPEARSFLGRFLATMTVEHGKSLTVEKADLAAGMLECVATPHAWTNAESMSTGVWDHFKGGIYKVRGFSRWASGEGEKVVEYTSLLFGTDHTRLATQWCEVVQWPDKKFRSRFVYRGPDTRTPEPAYKVPNPKP